MQKVVVKFLLRYIGLDRLYQSHNFSTFPVKVAEFFLQALGMEGAAEEGGSEDDFGLKSCGDFGVHQKHLVTWENPS